MKFLYFDMSRKYQLHGKGQKTAMLAILLSFISYGGFIELKWSYLFFYFSIFGIITVAVSLVKAIRNEGRLVLPVIAVVFVVLGIGVSYYRCLELNAARKLEKQELEIPSQEDELNDLMQELDM